MFNRRRVLTASAALPVVLGASACSTTGSSMTWAQVQAFIQQVKDKVNTLCGFLPEAEGLVALFGILPVVGTVESIAAMICQEVKVPPLTFAHPRVDMPYQVVVRGVTINGKFTR